MNCMGLRSFHPYHTAPLVKAAKSTPRSEPKSHGSEKIRPKNRRENTNNIPIVMQGDPPTANIIEPTWAHSTKPTQALVAHDAQCIWHLPWSRACPDVVTSGVVNNFVTTLSCCCAKHFEQMVSAHTRTLMLHVLSLSFFSNVRILRKQNNRNMFSRTFFF